MMKHKWKLLSPETGPLTSAENICGAIRFRIGWRLLCSKCKKCVHIPCDDLDTEGIAAFIIEQNKRRDCSDRKK